MLILLQNTTSSSSMLFFYIALSCTYKEWQNYYRTIGTFLFCCIIFARASLLPFPQYFFYVYYLLFVQILTLHFRPDDQIIDIPKVEGVHPKIGDVVTFSYDSLAPKTESPVNPIFQRIRYDVTWEDILQQHILDKSQKQDLNSM